MNVYSINVKIIATAYIKAEDEEEAERLFKKNYIEGLGGELPTSDNSGLGDLEVSGRQYDDAELPECSISPAISFYGAASNDGKIEFELVDENVPEDDVDG